MRPTSTSSEESSDSAAKTRGVAIPGLILECARLAGAVLLGFLIVGIIDGVPFPRVWY